MKRSPQAILFYEISTGFLDFAVPLRHVHSIFSQGSYHKFRFDDRKPWKAERQKRIVHRLMTAILATS
jgi:hypothetical protein